MVVWRLAGSLCAVSWLHWSLCLGFCVEKVEEWNKTQSQRGVWSWVWAFNWTPIKQNCLQFGRPCIAFALRSALIPLGSPSSGSVPTTEVLTTFHSAPSLHLFLVPSQHLTSQSAYSKCLRSSTYAKMTAPCLRTSKMAYTAIDNYPFLNIISAWNKVAQSITL